MGVESSNAPSPVGSIDKWPKLTLPVVRPELPSQPPLRTHEGAERKDFSSPNLIKLQGLVDQLHQATIVPDKIDPKDLDPKWAVWGLQALNLSHPVNYDQNSFERSKAVGRLIPGRHSDGVFDVRGLAISDTVFQADLKELRSLTLYQANLLNTVKTYTLLGDPNLLSPMLEEKLQIQRERVIRDIVNMGVDLFSQDVIEQSELPIQKKPGEEWNQQVDILRNRLIAVAMATADPNLKSAYLKILDPLQKEGGTEFSGEFNETSMMNPQTQESYLRRSIELLAANFEVETFEQLKPTPHQLAKTYELISEPIFKNLFDNLHESWEGTGAAVILGSLKDARALPGLVQFLRLTRSGHTGAYVSNTIFEIVKSPNNPETLKEVAESSDPTTRRILDEWFINPSAPVRHAMQYVENEGGYKFAVMVNAAPLHLTYTSLVNMAYSLGQRKGQEFDPDALKYYILGSFDDENSDYLGTKKIDEFLLSEDPHLVASEMAKSKATNWREVKPNLFNAVVNPKDGNYALFPRLIAEAIEVDPVLVPNLEALYQSKDLQTGSYARILTAEGLLYLEGRDDGKQILESLLKGLNINTVNGQRRVANADPERIRTIFRMMQSLDNLGGFTFEPKASLNEQVADLRHQTISAILEKLELEEANRKVVSERLPFILESGLLEIVPTLLSKYRTRDYQRQAQVVREISKHIILGDFQEWRNNLETARAQLAVLPEDKRAAWLTSANPIEIQINVQRDAELRQAAADAVQRIATEAKAHILDVYKLDFSPERLRQLKAETEPILKALKSADTPSEQKKELGIRKRSLDQEAAIVEGILNLESIQAIDLDPVKLLEYVGKLKNSLSTFEGLEQPTSDLAQIETVISTQAELKSVTKLRAFDSDDPLSLLKVGVEPRETCQSWRGGSYNDCLPAYVADANKRVINVVNDNNEVLGRSVAKLTHIREGDQMIPAILLEPIYTSSELAQIYRGVVRVALEKAKATGALLVLKNDIVSFSGASHVRTVSVLEQEAQKAGFKAERKNTEIFLPQSHNQSEYSDTLGGRMGRFETYVPGEYTIVKPAA